LTRVMRLFEAIVDANHRAVDGDASAGLHPADFADELPVIALTCIDPRLNALFPNALGLPAEQFIWLRNAGNIITGPLSSTMRSLALACAVKGGKEIAVIGHTDCQVAKTTTMQLLEKLREMGVERHLLPDNLNEFFGTFGSERQNVIKACDFVRHSPLIGPKIPIHGLLVDIGTGRLDWIVNGYQTLESTANRPTPPPNLIGQTTEKLGHFNIGEMKFPEAKIGELAANAEEWLKQKEAQIVERAEQVEAKSAEEVAKVAAQTAAYAEKHWPRTPAQTPSPPLPPKIPIPPPLRPRISVRRPGR
jgi:carbonic anhydrase